MKPTFFSNLNMTELLIRKRWLWHVLFWLGYAIFQIRNYYITIAYYDIKYLEFMLITRVPFVLATYLTIWFYKQLIPKHKYILYSLLGLVLWIGLMAGLVAFQKYYLRSMQEVAESEWMDLFWNQLPNYIIYFILVTMCKYFKDNFINQYYERERKNLQIVTELQHLKAQISPHFLFNTMNNFYGLAVDQSKKLPALMVGLSDLLRYSLYETNSPTVPLVHEIKYLKNYVELEKIRLEDTLDFEFRSEVDETSNVQVAPLLFVVFVENAFKHAKNVKDDVIQIRIRLSLSPNNILLFDVKNNCLKHHEASNLSSNGIGLENVRKRLDVLYPGNLHQLHIEEKDGFFHVQLKINLATT